MLTELDSAFGSLWYGLILVPAILLIIYGLVALMAGRKNNNDE